MKKNNDDDQYAALNLALSPPKTSSVHLLYFISQLTKQMRRIERIEQVEQLEQFNAPNSKSSSGGVAITISKDLSGNHNLARPRRSSRKERRSKSKKKARHTALLGPAPNNKRMFHLPTPEPLAVNGLIQKIKDHCCGLQLKPFSFPDLPQRSSIALEVHELIDVVAQAILDKPLPGIIFFLVQDKPTLLLPFHLYTVLFVSHLNHYMQWSSFLKLVARRWCLCLSGALKGWWNSICRSSNILLLLHCGLMPS